MVSAGVPDGFADAPGASLGWTDGAVDRAVEALGAGVRSVPLASGEAVGNALGTDPRPPVAPLQAARTATSVAVRRMDIERFMAGSRVRTITVTASARHIASLSPRGNDQVTGSRSSMRRPPDARFAAVR